MDKRIDIWNILHDGEITAVSWEGGDTLTMFVSIAFLREKLEPPGDGFILTLSGVTRFEFLKCYFSTTPSPAELAIGTPQIFGTKSESMPVVIGTTMGTLTLDFQSIAIALDTGQHVEFETIEKACEAVARYGF
jgi:hypothetical protein